MTVDWRWFFPPGTRVLALPDWQSPRLFLPAQRFAQRWEHSSYYPATRFRARFYRLGLRIRAATGLGETRRVQSSSWPLGKFASDVLPQIDSVVALVGAPGPVQKITVRLHGKGGVLGYLKYSEKEAARVRLRQERHVLSNLPGEVGPELIKFGSLGNGEALLTTALPGRPLPATLPPAGGLTDLLNSLSVAPPVPLEAHPWAQHVRDHGGTRLDQWLETLSDKNWPIVVQHGDFVPWNLLRRSNGTLAAIDWEYGTLSGFPYVDLAYYVLQTSALIYRQPPLKAAQYAAAYLTRQPQLGLSRVEAQALTRLAAYDVHQKLREDGWPDDDGMQAWRRTVWESRARDS